MLCLPSRKRKAYWQNRKALEVTMTEQQPQVSVVIPNWNGLKFLPPCMEALCAQTYPNVHVIVVDNASEDGSQAYLKEHYPQIELIEQDTNTGFTGACNTGMLAAQGEIIVLLNNDTEVHQDWAAEVVAAFDRHPKAGLVASKMLLASQRDTLHTAGDFVLTNGLFGNRGVWHKDAPEYNIEEPVFSACGGSSAYRKDMLNEIGILDDDFFFSCEDVDLGWRAQLSGWTCIYAPKAIVYHHLKATGGGATASYYDGRNTMWVIAKNMPSKLIRKYFWQIIGAQANRFWQALKAWRGAAARATMKGMLQGILTLPSALKKRNRIQQMRTVSIEYIDSMLTPTDGA